MFWQLKCQNAILYMRCQMIGVCELLQVNVPTAQMEEILPAARLLSRATSPTPSDYERAKSAFLRGVHEAAIQAQVCRVKQPQHDRQPLCWPACLLLCRVPAIRSKQQVPAHQDSELVHSLV